MARTKDFVAYLQKKLDKDPKLAAAVEKEAFNAAIAMQIYEARTAANLTQAELARRAGTRQSVIARMEDADYYGHSLNMLRRIATALGMNIRVDFYSTHSSRSLSCAQVAEISSEVFEADFTTSERTDIAANTDDTVQMQPLLGNW